MGMALPSVRVFMFEPDRLRELIRDAKAGNAESFNMLVRMHERPVLRLAQRFLLNREAARDAAQEVFLRLYQKIGTIHEDKDLGPWLYRTTANICFDLQRRAKNNLPLDVAADAASLEYDPEQNASARQQKECVLAALKELSPRERQAIVLRDLEGYSTAEVANLLGSTEATVRSQISTGRVKMRHFLRAQIRERE